MGNGAISANSLPAQSYATGPLSQQNPGGGTLLIPSLDVPAQGTGAPTTPTGGEAMLSEVARNFPVPNNVIRNAPQGAPETPPQNGGDTAGKPKESGGEKAAAPSPLKTTIEVGTALGMTTYAMNPIWGPTPEQKTSAFAVSSFKASEGLQILPELKADIHVAGGNIYFFDAWESSSTNVSAGGELSLKSPQLQLGGGHTMNAYASAGYDVIYGNYNKTDTTVIRDANLKAGASYTYEGSGTTVKLSGGVLRRDDYKDLLATNFKLLSYRADASQSLGAGWSVTGSFSERYFDFEDHPRSDVIHEATVGLEKLVKIEKEAADGTTSTVASFLFSGSAGPQWRDTNMPGTNLPGDPDGPGTTVHGREFDLWRGNVGVKVSF